MSLASWKREFYPTLRGWAKQRHPRGLAYESTLHSLRKWRGLRPAALAKHKVRVLLAAVVASPKSGTGENAPFPPERDRVDINSDSCALCAAYYDTTAPWEARCTTCPLFAVIGRSCGSGSGDPYSLFTEKFEVEPMITALETALGRLIK